MGILWTIRPEERRSGRWRGRVGMTVRDLVVAVVSTHFLRRHWTIRTRTFMKPRTASYSEVKKEIAAKLLSCD